MKIIVYTAKVKDLHYYFAGHTIVEIVKDLFQTKMCVIKRV